jgi:hypothetical protein
MFTVKSTLNEYGVGTKAYIYTYAILQPDGTILPGYGNLTSGARAQVYCDQRNSGADHATAFEAALNARV